MLKYRRTYGAFFLWICAWGCSRGGGSGAVVDLLCGAGHAQGKLTAGVNLDVFKRLGVSTTNDSLREVLNASLKQAGVAEDLLKISGVESIDDSSDESVRFLSVGGRFGPGVGVVTDLLVKAFGSSEKGASSVLSLGNFSSHALSSTPDASPLFSFLRESLLISAMAQDLEPVGTRGAWRALAMGERLRGGRNLLAHSYVSAAAHGPFAFDATRPFAHDLALTGQAHGLQWAFQQTAFQNALDLLQPVSQDRVVKVAVLDTGIDLSHPDLKDVVVDPFDATTGGRLPQDSNGHGTHCAGVIGATARSGSGAPLGVAAVDNVRIMPIKVLGDDGSGSTQNIDKGIRWAVKHGAEVLSMSLGGGVEFKDLGPEGLVNPLLNDALSSGITVVVAAGNEGCGLGGACQTPSGFFPKTYKEYTVLPCAYRGTICVGATNANETLAPYSNRASKKSGMAYRVKADLNAPGTAIYSTWPQAKGSLYKAISGTSMATPFVAGAAALIKARSPTMNQEQMRSLLLKSLVEPEDVIQKSEVGRLDLYKLALVYKNQQDPQSFPLPAELPGPHPVELPGELEQPGPDGSSPLVPLFTVWKVLCALR